MFIGGALGLLFVRAMAKKYRPEGVEHIDTLSKILLAMGGIGVVLTLVVVVAKLLFLN